MLTIYTQFRNQKIPEKETEFVVINQIFTFPRTGNLQFHVHVKIIY